MLGLLSSPLWDFFAFSPIKSASLKGFVFDSSAICKTSSIQLTGLIFKSWVIFFKFLQITSIFLRNDYIFNTTSMSCKKLFLKPPDFQNLSMQRYLSGHCSIGSNRDSSQYRNNGCTHTYPC